MATSLSTTLRRRRWTKSHHHKGELEKEVHCNEGHLMTLNDTPDFICSVCGKSICWYKDGYVCSSMKCHWCLCHTCSKLDTKVQTRLHKVLKARASEEKAPPADPQLLQYVFDDKVTLMKQKLGKIKRNVARLVNSRYPDENGVSLLHYAVSGEMAKYLIGKNADVNLRDTEGRTPLLNAICHSHDDVVKLLVDSKADFVRKEQKYKPWRHLNVIDVLNNLGESNLAARKLKSASEVVTELSVQPAWSPLHESAYWGRKSISKMLVEQGHADVNAVDENGMTPLHVAITGRHRYEIVDLLVKNEADLNAVDKTGKSAVHMSILKRKTNTLGLLIDEMADVDIIDKNGNSAIHYAALNGNNKLVEQLIYGGACYTSLNKDGITAFDLVAAQKRKWDRELLETTSKTLSFIQSYNEDVIDLMKFHKNASENDEFINILTDACGDRSLLNLVQKCAENARMLNLLTRRYSRTKMTLVEMKDLSSIQFEVEGNFVTVYSAMLQIRPRGFEIPLGAGTETLDQSLKIKVIIKVPNSGNSKEWYEIDLFQNIGTHPNILGLLGMCMPFNCEGKSSIAVVVGYKEGSTLKNYINIMRDHPSSFIDRSKMAKFGIDMARAVQHLHANGYIHNNIRARTYLLTEVESPFDETEGKQQLVLTSFHLSRKLTNQQTERIPYEHCWRWSSPETLRSNGAIYGPKSDIWMLGVSFYELISGKDPFLEFETQKSYLEYLRDPEKAKDIKLVWEPHFEVKDEGLVESWNGIIADCCSLMPERRPLPSKLIGRISAMIHEQPSYLKPEKTEFYKNIAHGWEEKVEAILKQGNSDINDQHQLKLGSVGWTPLHEAVYWGHIEIVRILFQQPGIQCNLQESTGMSPLHVAVSGRHRVDICKLLLDNDAELNLQTKTGQTALHYAVLNGYEDTIRLLIDRGVDLDIPDETGATAVHLASQTGDANVVKMLINAGSSFIVPNKDSVTVFDIEVARSQQTMDESLVKFLTKRFALQTAIFIDGNNVRDIRIIGEGNFGITYKAQMIFHPSGYKFSMNDGEDQVLRQPVLVPVVCKVPKLGAGEDEWYELQVLQNIPYNANVLSLIGMCMNLKSMKEKKQSLAFIVPFKEGGSLKTYLKKKGGIRSFHRMVKFAIDMTRGLAHLHKYGYIHNDVAARNYLLGEKEHSNNQTEGPQQITLVDFGLSRPIEDKQGLKNFPVKWAAPEVVLGKGTEYGTESDVWMLGTAFWELTSKGVRTPYPFMTIKEYKKCLADGAYKPHTVDHMKLDAECREAWKTLIGYCSQWVPEKRKDLPEITGFLRSMLSLPDSDIVVSFNSSSSSKQADGTDKHMYDDLEENYLPSHYESYEQYDEGEEKNSNA